MHDDKLHFVGLQYNQAPGLQRQVKPTVPARVVIKDSIQRR